MMYEHQELKNKFERDLKDSEQCTYDNFLDDVEVREIVKNKYVRKCKGVEIDVYDVLLAFKVTNPALQHLIKKALCVGIRGHKSEEQDLKDILDSAERAVEIGKERRDV